MHVIFQLRKHSDLQKVTKISITEATNHFYWILQSTFLELFQNFYIAVNKNGCSFFVSCRTNRAINLGM